MGAREDEILRLVKEADPINPTEYVESIVRDFSVEKLKESIRTCHDCDVSKYTNIKSIPTGRSDAPILVISEGIYGSQVEEGKEECAPLGENTPERSLFNDTMELLHINQDYLFFMNTVNCYTCSHINNKNLERAPSSREINGCRGFTDYAIKIMDPVFIILLGNIPYNLYHKGTSVKQDHGKIFDIHGIPAMPVYSLHTLVELEHDEMKDLVDEYETEFVYDLENAFKYIRQNVDGGDMIFLEEKEEEQENVVS